MGGRPRRHDTGSAELRDGCKNAVEGRLKANHLALHDIVEDVRGEEGRKRGIEPTTGLEGGIDVYETGIKKV
jgi:hypothetical protein